MSTIGEFTEKLKSIRGECTTQQDIYSIDGYIIGDSQVVSKIKRMSQLITCGRVYKPRISSLPIVIPLGFGIKLGMDIEYGEWFALYVGDDICNCNLKDFTQCVTKFDLQNYESDWDSLINLRLICELQKKFSDITFYIDLNEIQQMHWYTGRGGECYYDPTMFKEEDGYLRFISSCKKPVYLPKGYNTYYDMFTSCTLGENFKISDRFYPEEPFDEHSGYAFRNCHFLNNFKAKFDFCRMFKDFNPSDVEVSDIASIALKRISRRNSFEILVSPAEILSDIIQKVSLETFEYNKTLVCLKYNVNQTWDLLVIPYYNYDVEQVKSEIVGYLQSIKGDILESAGFKWRPHIYSDIASDEDIDAFYNRYTELSLSGNEFPYSYLYYHAFKVQGTETGCFSYGVTQEYFKDIDKSAYHSIYHIKVV